ncbi:MAG: glycerol-3-phosphate dehydrogenase/oxidase [Actinobacteria bacterium]|nr:MAG: glycerol-3-phosphate dehydrogenase/oxidase [Actinomycetota bacterium]
MVEPVPGVAPHLSRRDSIDRLGSLQFDLLVIGGGIIGAATAAHAARAGLAVALVDAGDFGGGTSSASSKLIHGGLRYLRLGDVRLVREAHHERRLLSRLVAPHLVHRLPFLFPLYRGGPYRPWVVQSGILFYSALAQSRLNWLVDAGRAQAQVPGLRVDGLRSCALYADAWTNDARLTLGNVRAAADAGAVVLNGAEVVALRVVDGSVAGAEVRVDGVEVEVAARAIVNSAGPWVDQVRKLEDASVGTSVRLSKGAHVVVEAETEWSAALTVPQDLVRVTFAVPWYGMLLLGTTETPYDGDPGGVAASAEDVDQILSEAAVALDPALVGHDRVRATFAGLRVLPVGAGESVSARRETVYTVGRAGMLSVAGGKLTTYRRIALGVLERLRGQLGLREVDRAPWPLPGASGPASMRDPEALDSDVLAHLRHLYGSMTAEVLAPAEEDPSLLDRLDPAGPDIAAQALYAATHEWARSSDDVIRRRTTLFYRGLAGDEVVQRVNSLLAR